MAETLATLVERDVETTREAQGVSFIGFDATTGRVLELEYAGGWLVATLGAERLYEGYVAGSTSSDECTLAAACEAAGVTLVATDADLPTTLRAAEVETECGGCPTTFVGQDVRTGREVRLRYRNGTLTATRGFAVTYEGPIRDARSDGVCSLEEACRAAGITLDG